MSAVYTIYKMIYSERNYIHCKSINGVKRLFILPRHFDPPPKVVDGSTDSVSISAALFAEMDPHTPTHIIFDFSKSYIMSHRPVVVRV